MQGVRFLRVAVPSPLYRDFDYLPPPGVDPTTLTPGLRLALPFGRREVVGVLLDTVAESAVPAAKLKAARRLLDETPVIPPDMLALARWAADYYRHPMGEVVHTLLPVLLRQGRPASVPGETLWRLNAAGQAGDTSILARAPRQQALHTLLKERPAGLSSSELKDHTAALRALAKRGWLERSTRSISAPTAPPSTGGTALNPAQAQAVDGITAALGSYRAFLLDGVTGSGKTEVYMSAIAAAVARGQQALVLLPEINLTPQTLARFRARFGEVAAFHSGLNESERLATWLATRDGRASV
ncbi:MAG: DEAD/DEAH box helicase, partial [Gammaproteobacteria bacterium]